MAKYLVIRIEAGALTYADVIAKKPALKEEIDTLLEADGYTISTDGTICK